MKSECLPSEHLEAELNTFVETRPAYVVLNVVSVDNIFSQSAFLMRPAHRHIVLISDMIELKGLEQALQVTVKGQIMMDHEAVA